MICKIIGAFFRPPAKALLDALSLGTPLIVCPDNDNEFDDNAVAVLVRSEDICQPSRDLLAETLGNYGYTLEDVLAQPAWQLGYVPRTDAPEVRALLNGRPEALGLFQCDASGKPLVEFS